MRESARDPRHLKVGTRIPLEAKCQEAIIHKCRIFLRVSVSSEAFDYGSDCACPFRLHPNVPHRNCG